MLKFACKDLGLNCNFETSGATTEEVMKKITTHAQVVHKDLMAKMTPQEAAEFNKKVMSKIH